MGIFISSCWMMRIPILFLITPGKMSVFFKFGNLLFLFKSSLYFVAACVPPNCIPSQNIPSVSINRPNDLPSQLDKMYSSANTMQKALNEMVSLLQDASAGVPIGYLDDRTKYPLGRYPFPVLTPPYK